MQEMCRQTKRQLGREPLAHPHYPRMVNERHYDRVMHLLAGELAVIGGYGRRQTLQIAPTVLRDVSPEAPVMQEEIFGPVLPMLAFDRLEEALRFVKERENRWRSICSLQIGRPRPRFCGRFPLAAAVSTTP